MNKALLSQSKLLTSYFLLLPMLLFCISSKAQQPGEMDTSFNPEEVDLQIGGFRSNSSAAILVLATALQEDNKIIIGGKFSSYEGQDRNSIARLHEDGSLDLDFDPGTGFDNDVETIAVQSDGKILVGGPFKTFNDISRPSIARLNADGSLDTSFDPGNGFNHKVQTIVVQPDGKILVGGEFTSFNEMDCNYIARLNTDGTFDAGFDSGAGFSEGTIKDIAIQSDEKIIVGGSFRRFDGINRSGIARLNADGSLDTSFDPGHGVDGQIQTLALQSDGKIIAGGLFYNFNSKPCKSMVRLNPDGNQDLSFTMGLNFSGQSIVWFNATAVQPDGKIIIGGDFNSFNNGETETNKHHIARLHEDGSIDTGFDSNTNFNQVIWTLSLQTDGRIVVGGAFTHFGDTRDYICRLKNQGSIDPSFNYVSGFDNMVNATAVQQDGKIVVGGNFLSFSDKNCTRIARLNADGTLDTSFDTGIGFNSAVMALAIQEDGKIIVGGMFDNFNGSNRKGIFRLNTDGSLDSSFEGVTVLNGYPKNFILLPDGKVIVGYIYSYNGEYKYSVVRLNSDGSLDTGFSHSTGFDRGIETAAIQGDGKIVVGGDFQDYKGLGLNHILRLNADGSLDTDFNPGTGFSGPVSSLVIQEDGKIIVVGNFEKFDGTDRKGIARLNEDGSLDTDFDPGDGFVGRFSTIALHADGQLILAGEFTSYDGIGRNRIARINQDGSLDVTFDPGTGFNGATRSIIMQPEEKLLIGGWFTSYNDSAGNFLVRLHAGVNEVTALPGNKFDKDVLIYPNPFTSEFSIKLLQRKNPQVQVLVRDLTGRAVRSEAVITTDGHDLSVKLDENLPNGMYLLQLRDKQETVSYKVIKK